MLARPLACLMLAACSFTPQELTSDGGGGGDAEVIGGSRRVTGSVIDFQSGGPLANATITTSGLGPAVTVTVTGNEFTLEGVPNNSTFQLLASVGASHRATFGPAVTVDETDVSGIVIPVVSEAFLAGAASEFQLQPRSTHGILITQIVDEAAQPQANIPDTAFDTPSPVDGPHFFNQNLLPDRNARSSSSSGWSMFIDVPPGTFELAAASGATVEMARVPVAAGTITLARTRVIMEPEPPLPENVSFANQIVPIFPRRGCIACHTGGQIGHNLGGLKLDGPTQQVYDQLVVQSNRRVVTSAPETSLVLTRPSLEVPADVHPNVTFTSSKDPDYLLLLVWIREGAREN